MTAVPPAIFSILIGVPDRGVVSFLVVAFVDATFCCSCGAGGVRSEFWLRSDATTNGSICRRRRRHRSPHPDHLPSLPKS
jgi:hypothetical protein